jgi:uncharacterized RDD family membrane protein YckC
MIFFEKGREYAPSRKNHALNQQRMRRSLSASNRLASNPSSDSGTPMNPRLPLIRPTPAPPWRRAIALGIDGLAVGLISSLLGRTFLVQGMVFLIGWLLMRVVLVSSNKGQSLGRWAMDLRVIDQTWGGTPTLLDLTRREGLLGAATFLAVWGLMHLSPTAAWVLLLLVPLGVDASFAYSDVAYRQAFHDRYSHTWVVESRRGYSLDVKIRQLVAEIRARVKQ